MFMSVYFISLNHSGSKIFQTSDFNFDYFNTAEHVFATSIIQFLLKHFSEFIMYIKCEI